MKEHLRKAQIGKLGEDLASRYLVSIGFLIERRNYWRPYGEIDVIARKGDKFHFCEVKTVTCEIGDAPPTLISQKTDNWSPEENVHPLKLWRLSRVIQTYVLSLPESADWQFDVIAVFLDQETKKAIVRITEDVTLGE